MLAGRTRFIINPATRIIAIDLNNVVGDKSAEGQLRTGIMYLFAGQISGGDFILPQYRKELMEAVPDMYRALHAEKSISLTRKLSRNITTNSTMRKMYRSSSRCWKPRTVNSENLVSVLYCARSM
jgi:hypothetical protein